MLEIKAYINDSKVAVETSADGMGIEIVAESLAIARAMYDDLKSHNLEDIFISELGTMLVGWIHEHKSESGDGYA